MPDSKTKEIMIQGVLVTVSQPYEAGHTITEAEARALNQTRAENIGNNVRGKVKEMLESENGNVEKVAKPVQELVAQKDAEYEFTLASVGGGGSSRLDPLTKECRSIARDFVHRKIKESGKTLKEYKEANGDDSINEKIMEVAENPKIVEVAKKNLKQREQLADLGDIA